jgi:hypothetical protein
MKKSTLKLKLNRETLRTLEKSQLEGVEGAATLTACATECLGSCNTCNTRNTCTSRYC